MTVHFIRPLTLAIVCGLAGAASAQIADPAQTDPNYRGAPITSARDSKHEDYDIRDDASPAAQALRARFLEAVNINPPQLRHVQQLRTDAINAATVRNPNLVVEYSADSGKPEVLAVAANRVEFLSNKTGANRVSLLRDYLHEVGAIYGLSDRQIDDLNVVSDYSNPNGLMHFVHLEQRINGFPVFRGEIKAGFAKNGELVRVIGNVLAYADPELLGTDAGDPSAAVRAAAANLGVKIADDELISTSDALFDGHNATFKSPKFQNNVTAEAMIFPIDDGVGRLCWRVLLWQPTNAFYVIVDAKTGAVLWRKNISEDQTTPATYSVYQTPSPAPLLPAPTSPNGVQGDVIARNTITLIGNEAPNTFNNLGWITDGTTVSTGNNVDAGLDRDGTNGVDPTGRASSATRNFSFAYNPAPGNPAPGEAPLSSVAFQNGVVTNLFYLTNFYHDRLYRLGFTEAARNFQNDNFGRGGAASDRVSAEAQDSSGTSNANFGTPADGGAGRMQMYLFTGPTLARDGSLDADVVLHELSHGLSNRLVGNASGLTGTQARGMGEGWGDFYARALLAKSTEPANGVYSSGGWATYQITGATYVNNYYYGIRRFPYALLNVVGGPNNLPHNPMTFADVDPAQISLVDGAFPRGPIGSATANEVHNIGEVWCMMLLEVRAKLIARLGFAVGNERALQLVTDGLKLSPLNPTMVQARDAILAAAAAGTDSADITDIWAGFAIRGMGFGASTNGTNVVESFAVPGINQSQAIVVGDSQCNDNGVADPGEVIDLQVPLTNSAAATALNTVLSLNAAATRNYGDISASATVSRTHTFTVPLAQACGSEVNLDFVGSSSLGSTSFQRKLLIGTPNISLIQNFDGVVAPALPANWSSTNTGAVNAWVSSTALPVNGTTSAFVNDPVLTGEASLTSLPISITSANNELVFEHTYATEVGFDGGVLELKIGAAGAFQDLLTAGGSFVSGGYGAALGGTTGCPNPLAGRAAWSGSNSNLITRVRFPAAAVGQQVQLRWRFSADCSGAGTGANVGWRIDNIRMQSGFLCAPATCSTNNIFANGFEGN